MLIDPHVHSKEISLCSHVTTKEIVEEKLKLNVNGVALVNHIQSWYYKPEEQKEYLKRYLDCFYEGREYARKRDFVFILGAEITLDKPKYADWLVYGIDEKFFKDAPCFYQMTQEELYKYVKSFGALMIQAHPFRNPIVPGDPMYMDGMEINCRDIDLPHLGKVLDFCKENKKYVICGTDYHSENQRQCMGTIVPDTVKDSFDFVDAIVNNKIALKYTE